MEKFLKANRGENTHAHTRLKRERERERDRERERCCYRRVILTTARERILCVLVLTKSRKAGLLKVKMHSTGGLP